MGQVYGGFWDRESNRISENIKGETVNLTREWSCFSAYSRKTSLDLSRFKQKLSFCKLLRGQGQGGMEEAGSYKTCVKDILEK